MNSTELPVATRAPLKSPELLDFHRAPRSSPSFLELSRTSWNSPLESPRVPPRSVLSRGELRTLNKNFLSRFYFDQKFYFRTFDQKCQKKFAMRSFA